MRKAYKNLSEKELILRDYLAIDRTKLAAERTMLAYLRTALTLIIAGVTISKLFEDIYYQLIAAIFMAGGIAMIGYSFYRLKKANTANYTFQEIED